MDIPRILVVEDEKIIAGHLRANLLRLGYEVIAAVPSGEEAIIAAEEKEPDLVLMDILLKGEMDGIEAADHIRTLFGIPVIYLTAHANESILARAKLTEPLGYLLKPFRQQELRMAIEVALYKHRLEERLRDSERRHRELAELLPQVVFELDREGNLTFVNRNGLQAFGYSRQDTANSVNVLDLTAPADRQKLAGEIAAALRGAPSIEIELTALRKDGTSFPAITYATPAMHGGEIVGVRGVTIDITETRRQELALQESLDEMENRVAERTAELAQSNRQLKSEVIERKKAEDEARRNEELFRTIFESARDCIFIKNEAGKYILVNPEMQSLLDLPTEEILGRTEKEIFGAGVPRHLAEVDGRVLKGELIEQEYSRPVNGVELTFHDIRVPLKNKKGRIVGLCGICRNITERRKAKPELRPGDIRYPSRTMQATLEDAQLAASSDSIILLLGESGSGKDHLARWIHDHSGRSKGPFFTMNCAAIAENLAESELFGHEAGAFTGARGRVRGLLELAEGGTLLLNEIGDLPITLQAKLLTFLDTRSFHRLGGREEVRVNARLIAATNRDLEKEAAEGRFRKDLFFRLNVFSIKLPALRERVDDISVLVNRLIAQLADELQLSTVPDVTPATLKRLTDYQWPGNVRELRNVLERGLILSGGSDLVVDALTVDGKNDKEWGWSVNFPPPDSLPDSVNSLKRSLVEHALVKSGGNRQEAAKSLGISRYTLRRYIKSFASEWGNIALD
jgi:PAS domain S-box-containing protein